MAISVPSEPKIYTTVYDNFKGVDFTNDVTNVYRRRSPDGLNMLPDLDGRPYKRTGWAVELTAEDFRDAARLWETVSDEPITPDRTYYFQMNGYDYLMIFNSLGVFSYAEPYRTGPGESISINGKYLVYEKPVVDSQLVTMPSNINTKTCFFFEGKGTTGFYMFAGLILYRYDGSRFHIVDPYVPFVLHLCNEDGVGEMYEQVNMLTPKRTVGYACDGVKTTFAVPGGYAGILGNHVVETRDVDTGEWEAARYYNTSATDGNITFEAGHAPAKVVAGEDNLRITYIPNGSEYVQTTRQETKTWSSSAEMFTYYRREYRNGAWTAWTKTGDMIETGPYPARIYDDGIMGAAGITVTAGGSTLTSGSDYTLSFDPYRKQIAVRVAEAHFLNCDLPYSDTPYTNYQKYITKDYYNNGIRVQEAYDYYIRRIPATVTYTCADMLVGTTVGEGPDALSKCGRALIYGNGIINSVFLTASTAKAYSTRVWWSAPTDPTYFPDLNYIEVGADDTDIMGLIKVGEYLGVVKKGSGTNTSVYLAYPTSFADDTTYAVKQSINGIGAVAYGAFNILEDEPLFLSPEGVMAIEARDGERQLRNRSYFVNKKLTSEPGLDSAFSFVYDGMFLLAVNNHVYVLDGSQKNSWANTKTNLQYEAYYLDNVPAQCFAKMDDSLYFTDFSGGLCRFKKTSDMDPYHDGYPLDQDWSTTQTAVSHTIPIQSLTPQREQASPAAGETILSQSNGIRTGYTITEVNETSVVVGDGVPITAVWSTIADDDGAVHFFKNLKKKGSLVSLLPSSDSGVQIYLKPDRKEPVFVCETDAKQIDIPFDAYMKKKIKKYKRLQIICKNSTLDDAFGVDQIIKCYTMGNYSKNRG